MKFKITYMILSVIGLIMIGWEIYPVYGTALLTIMIVIGLLWVVNDMDGWR